MEFDEFVYISIYIKIFYVVRILDSQHPCFVGGMPLLSGKNIRHLFWDIY